MKVCAYKGEMGFLKHQFLCIQDYVLKSCANRLRIFILYCAAPKSNTPIRGIMSIHVIVFMFFKNDKFLFICGSLFGFICLNYLDSVMRLFSELPRTDAQSTLCL